jgi:hypothetical protein
VVRSPEDSGNVAYFFFGAAFLAAGLGAGFLAAGFLAAGFSWWLKVQLPGEG